MAIVLAAVKEVLEDIGKKDVENNSDNSESRSEDVLACKALDRKTYLASS